MVERKVPRVVQLTSAHWVLDARIFHKISKSLVRAGYEVILVGRGREDETVDGVRIVVVPKIAGRLRRMTVTFWRIYRKAVQLNGDIYHFHDPELMLVGLLLRLRGKTVIYDAHEDLPRTVFYKEYLPRSLRRFVAWAIERIEMFAAARFNAVIGATPPIADRFHRVSPRTVVVNNFPMLEEITSAQPRAREQRSSAVVYLGSIARERGIFELVEAVNALPATTNCRLALAGWFSPAGLQQEIQKLPGAGRVDCLGRLSRVQVAELLADVKVGIVPFHRLPNLTNSRPTKLFEYMCAGLPVVASDFPLWRELIQEARCGLLVDPHQPAQIAAAIEYLLSHPNEAEQMGRNGRAYAERFFSWKSEERVLIDLYRSILPQQASLVTEQIECA